MGDWGRHGEEQGGKTDIHTADRLRSRPGCHRALKVRVPQTFFFFVTGASWALAATGHLVKKTTTTNRIDAR